MVDTLTGPRFARAVRAGALSVVRRQEILNRINVFPVADADTGANMAATLRSAASCFAQLPPAAIEDASRAAADAAIDGARGNSGAIFAQFLHGLAEGLHDRVQVGPEEFATAARRGADAARTALQDPREGTILSVVSEWADAIEQHAPDAADFKDLLGRGLDRARQALADTPKSLEVLAKNDVVDAGAQGFVYFLEGISTFFRDRRAADWRRAGLSLDREAPFAAAHADTTGSLTFRYCTEGLLRGDDLDRDAVTAEVATLGDSLVVAGGSERLRVHLHTNEPQRFLGILASHGRLERTKIDDMVLQNLAVRGATVAVVTDSTCDLPESRLHRLGLIRVPLVVAFGDESFRDGIDITPAQFYQRLADDPELPRTSQPSIGEFKETYRKILETHETILVLPLSSALSGTYQAAATAADQLDPDRIRVVDTRQVSLALGFVVEAAAEAVAAGADLDTAEAAARECAERTAVFAAIPTLEMALRGGRLSAKEAGIAKVLGLKPVIAFDDDGKAVKDGVHVGFGRALKGLAKRAERFADDRPVRLMIAHANAVGAAEHLAEELCRRFGVSDIPVVNLAAVIAAHGGPGTVAVAVQKRRARERS